MSPRPDADRRRIRVLLVDDQALVTDALSRILERMPDMLVVGVAATVREVKELARTRVHVVLMDYALPDGTGADATRVVKSRWPAARVVMLTGASDDTTMYESIRAGADGYLTKDRAVDQVADAVRAAHAGETLLPNEVLLELARRIKDGHDPDAVEVLEERLTNREQEILRLLAEGLPSAHISAALGISPNTLRTHVQSIIRKLHVHSKLEAVAFGLRHGLIEPPRLPR